LDEDEVFAAVVAEAAALVDEAAAVDATPLSPLGIQQYAALPQSVYCGKVSPHSDRELTHCPPRLPQVLL
jgi:hypothetical protein